MIAAASIVHGEIYCSAIGRYQLDDQMEIIRMLNGYAYGSNAEGTIQRVGGKAGNGTWKVYSRAIVRDRAAAASEGLSVTSSVSENAEEQKGESIHWKAVFMGIGLQLVKPFSLYLQGIFNKLLFKS